MCIIIIAVVAVICCYHVPVIIRHCQYAFGLPSWELTYPIPRHFWRGISFSQGGIFSSPGTIVHWFRIVLQIRQPTVIYLLAIKFESLFFVTFCLRNRPRVCHGPRLSREESTAKHCIQHENVQISCLLLHGTQHLVLVFVWRLRLEKIVFHHRNQLQLTLPECFGKTDDMFIYHVLLFHWGLVYTLNESMIHNAFWIPYITLPPGIYSYNAYMGYVCFRVINLIWITSMLKPQNKFETKSGSCPCQKSTSYRESLYPAFNLWWSMLNEPRWFKQGYYCLHIISIYIYTHTYVYRLIVELRLRSEKNQWSVCLEDTAHWKLQQKDGWEDLSCAKTGEICFLRREGCTAESSVYAILHVFIVRISRHLQRKHPLWINHYNEQSHVFFFNHCSLVWFGSGAYGFVILLLSMWTFRNPLKRTLVPSYPSVRVHQRIPSPIITFQEGYWDGVWTCVV